MRFLVRKRLFSTIAIVLSAALASTAYADSLPGLFSSPVAYGAAHYNWSGIYLGGNIGWAQKDINWRYANPSPANCCAPFSAGADSGVAGGQVGLQYQWGSLVLGVELAGTDLNVFNDNSPQKLGCTAAGTQTCAANFDTLWTAGGRLGWAAGRWMAFGTGGFAEADIDTKVVNSDLTVFDTANKSHEGWYAGGGIEYALTHHVIIGVEYQHVDLGTELHISSADGGIPAGVNGRDIGSSIDMVRARYSILFGGEREEALPLK